MYNPRLPYSSRLKSLKLLPISYWFELKDLTFYYKCKSGGYDININQYTSQPPSRSTRSSSSDQLRPNLCKTTSFRSSYFNRVIIFWNNLPSCVKSLSFYAMFKAKLYNHYLNNSDFSVERPRTFKTLCVKCRSSNISCCS